MDQRILIDGLVSYVCFLPILTFHEFAHAWVAWKCGDDTARLQGRVSLNPTVHIDLVGTIVLPLLAVILSAANSALAGFIIGWGKPVPVNIANLRHRRRDDTMVALAGPAMNVLLAIGILAVVKIGVVADWPMVVAAGQRLALLSLFLCFFNLLPVPPLDGSHVLKNAVGMSDEAYWRFCQFGLIAVIIVVQIPFVWRLIEFATYTTLGAIAGVFRLGA
ncbi:MAG: site-2 protease family protein [Verrucomicrobia bacterium]|nr:site-2 protease family protein [Verrucomicrobiota bacterium]